MAEFVAQGNAGNCMPVDYSRLDLKKQDVCWNPQGTLVTGGNFAAIWTQQWYGRVCGTREHLIASMRG